MTKKNENLISFTCAACGQVYETDGAGGICPNTSCNSPDIAGTSAEDRLRHYLAPLGVELSYHTVDGGSYDRASKFACTIARGSASHTLEYTKGSAHRVWKNAPRTSNLNANAVNVKALRGEPAQVRYGWKLYDSQREEFDRITAATPPTAAEVLAAMSSDAECVRHGQTFDDFCADLGYDSDSRTAERAYNACRDEWAALVRLGFDLDTLSELCREL